MQTALVGLKGHPAIAKGVHQVLESLMYPYNTTSTYLLIHLLYRNLNTSAWCPKAPKLIHTGAAICDPVLVLPYVIRPAVLPGLLLSRVIREKKNRVGLDTVGNTIGDAIAVKVPVYLCCADLCCVGPC